MRFESLGEELVKIASYGVIAFDHYALEHWNYEAPREEDGAQWRRLVMEYLDLSQRHRSVYKAKASDVLVDGPDDGSQPLLTPSNIERVLKPFQSIRERNLTQLCGPWRPVWITACYEESLHQKYCDLERQAEVGGTGVEVEMVLSDPDTYNINGDTKALAARIVERLPGLFDHNNARRRGVAQDLVSLSNRMEGMVYVADKESVLGGFVKVFWFDGHGQLLLASRLEPEELEGMTAMFSDGYSMDEALDEKCLASYLSSIKERPPKEGSDAEWETESEYGSG
ncbi:hypothetical protein MY11210_004861 [Beauveria gryllotalpidicola]